MTKYELKMKKKLERAEKRKLKKEKRLQRRLDRKQKRIEKRKERRFNKQSDAKYRVWHRMIVKLFRIVGPLLAFAFIIWKLSELFGDIRTNNMVGALDLDMAVMLLFFGSVVFIAAIWYGLRWMKKATTANAIARNEGKPSLYYSPLIVTSIRFILGAWFFGLMFLFNYIGLNYGEAMHNGFEYMGIAYVCGFFSLMIGDIIEQSILKRIRSLKHEAEHEARADIKDLKQQISALKKDEA